MKTNICVRIGLGWGVISAFIVLAFGFLNVPTWVAFAGEGDAIRAAIVIVFCGSGICFGAFALAKVCDK